MTIASVSIVAVNSILRVFADAQALGACGTLAKENGLKVILHSNIAEACLRMEQWVSARAHAEQALKLDPRHFKSMRRLAASISLLEEAADKTEDQTEVKVKAEPRVELRELAATDKRDAVTDFTNIQALIEAVTADTSRNALAWAERERQPLGPQAVKAAFKGQPVAGMMQQDPAAVASIAVAAFVTSLQSGMVASRHDRSAEAQVATRVHDEFASPFHCPKCGAGQPAVMPDTAQKWLDQGCPSCKLPIYNFKSGMTTLVDNKSAEDSDDESGGAACSVSGGEGAASDNSGDSSSPPTPATAFDFKFTGFNPGQSS